MSKKNSINQAKVAMKEKANIVTVTNGEIFNSLDAIRELVRLKFPVLTSVSLARLAQRLDTERKPINEAYNALIEKYGEPDEKGQPHIDDSFPRWKEFEVERQTLFAQEIEWKYPKAQIPLTVAATCDKCHHNMERPLELEPLVFLTLDKFLELRDGQQE